MSQNDDIDELLRKLGDEDFSTIPENNFDTSVLESWDRKSCSIRFFVCSNIFSPFGSFP